ncbi:RhoGAP-domain-containing protein [Exidia glandulosa HHB12029]|uniref:RhoGAP-domain-containing protein n=1 Tax=Exidia glandulosa HHB12029 TaxID=1314781 RepID=A0A165BLV4_EXIGL|nr:RhoGAP-domain-containing protein [Exidia glandulosa HHB12029]
MTQSLQQSFGPAAAAASGMALGFGKKAYDKVERLWGGNNTAQAPVGSAPFSNRAASAGSANSARNGGLRRTPNAPSGAWSIASMSMSSDEGSTHSGSPHMVGADLGPCLRSPRPQNSYSAPVTGLVFGRALVDCVRDTRVSRVVYVTASSPKLPHMGAPARDIEERALPALIVRCVQHLRRWGVEEEGLFRISGRASHIAKLRSEFDTGADYDLKQANPGQLDPHAVASVFKAYLRELPEPLLTRSLTPLFDEVVASTPNTHNQQMHEFYGLPAGPRTVPQMRKPPSLSNLGPNASPLLLHKVSTLVARLPLENRDTLFTVIELLKTTANNSKATKMPLANLLLLFCPSLQVSPTLLRVLCEADNIWDGPLPAPVTTPSSTASEHETVPEESDAERLSEESLRPPTLRHERVVSGVGLGALSGGPRSRQGVPMRMPVPGMSPSQLADVFTAQSSPTPSPSAMASTPSINLPDDEKPLPKSPHTPHTPESRTSEGVVSLPSRRLSIFGINKSPNSSSSQVSTPNSVRSYDESNPPASPSSMRGIKRNGMRPSLQLMFSNKRSREDLLSPRSGSPHSNRSGSPMPSGTPQSTTLALPPVLTVPIASPGFSTSLESFMSEDARTPSPTPFTNAHQPTDFIGSRSTLSLANSNANSSSSSSRSTSSLVIPVSEEARNLSVHNLDSGRRSPSPNITSAISTTITPTTASSDETPVQTPIADMFRSPSRAGTFADEQDQVVVLLPPLSFSQSPMFSPSPGAMNPPPQRTTAPFSPPPRLDLKVAPQQDDDDDDDDWARVVLSAAGSSPVKPLRVRAAVQQFERRPL